jgi:phosphocarrier protein HPr
MKKAELVLINKAGLHARPAALFVQTAHEFNSQVTVECDGRSVDAKSLLEILSLGALKGSKITIITEGIDEDQALNELVKITEEGLGEEG